MELLSKHELMQRIEQLESQLKQKEIEIKRLRAAKKKE